VEIRLLSMESGELVSLLAHGMDEEAICRKLYRHPKQHGVTGYVAHTGRSYLLEDIEGDPYYLLGYADAKSSLTVPLVYHDQVIGTFNVESPIPRAFTKKDMRFLELFAIHVASAINTLELLTTEKAETAAASVEAIHGAIALLINGILNDVSCLQSQIPKLESLPDARDRLTRILGKAREIKAVIHIVGQNMTPAQAHPYPPKDKYPFLRNGNILIVDEDENIPLAANAMLAKFGCNVESSPTADEAFLMIGTTQYDAIMVDIRLPNCNGYQFLLRLREMMKVEPLPLILMAAFDYDPAHVIVNAKQEGIDTVLFKPFTFDRLVSVLEVVLKRKKS